MGVTRVTILGGPPGARRVAKWDGLAPYWHFALQVLPAIAFLAQVS